MSDITDLHQLHEYLYKAMQLEHGTLPPYLTALYSIDFAMNPDAMQILRAVAVEEMLHLTLAANILNAVGGAPDPTRKGFVPRYPTPLPDGEDDFEVELLPFGEKALDSFLQIERPKETPPNMRLITKAAAPPGAIHMGPPQQPQCRYYSIGEFYTAIEDGIRFLEGEAQKNGQTIFTGDRAKQVTPEYYYSGGGEIIPVYDLESAGAAGKLIIEQGEGQTGDPYSDRELAHYYRFKQLKHGKYYLPGDKEDHPSGPPCAVDWTAIQPVTPNLKLAQLPEGSELRNRAEEFNQQYAEFLALLKRAYNGEPHLLLDAVPTMFRFRDRIVELIRNPIPGRATNAGPTFEIP
jgi:ferritin-like protein